MSGSLKQRKLSVSFDNNAGSKKPLRDSKPGRQILSLSDRTSRSAPSSTSTASTSSFVNKPASSLRALRNRILISIEKAIKLTNDFQQAFLKNPDDDFHGVYQEFIKQLLAKTSHKTDLLTTDQLDSVIIKKFSTEATVAERADFRALAVVCQRAKAFKELAIQVQRRIDEVYRYADAFCVAFSNEANGLSFESMERYENVRTECLKTLLLNLDLAKASSDELKAIHPLNVYLESYSRVLHHMEHIASCLYLAASSLKKWIIADEQYEKSLEKELSYVKACINQLCNDRTVYSSAQFEVRARTANEAGKSRQVQLMLSKYRLLVDELLEQQKTLTKTVADLKEQQRQLRRDLVIVEKQTSRRLKPNQVFELLPTAESLSDSMKRLEEEEDVACAELKKVDTQLVSVTKEIHMLEHEKSRRIKSAAHIFSEIEEKKEALKNQSDTVQLLQQKFNVLKKLRSLKQDKTTLRKMELNIVNHDYKEAMMMVIYEVAQKVGCNWPELYLKLSFLPARPQEKLNQDIKTIQLTGLQLGKNSFEMAVAAFEKWAKRSVIASVSELQFLAKPFTEQALKKEFERKSRYCVPRIKKRFQHLSAKSSVIYV